MQLIDIEVSNRKHADSPFHERYMYTQKLISWYCTIKGGGGGGGGGIPSAEVCGQFAPSLPLTISAYL